MYFPFSPEIEMEDGWSCLDPSDSYWVSTKDPDQGYVKVEFATPTPPSIYEVKAYASNESSMSDYCRFAQVVLSMPPIEGFDLDFNVGFEQVDGSPSYGPQERFILYANHALWHQVMKTKDLQPEIFRWYLRLKKFDFVVRDKANVHTLLDSDQA